VVRLCDVLLESPAVGLLGLRIFELPGFSKQLPGREREGGVLRERLRGPEENAESHRGRYEGGHSDSDEAPCARNSHGRRGVAGIRGGSPENGL
jgi:hypothetical protein